MDPWDPLDGNSQQQWIHWIRSTATFSDAPVLLVRTCELELQVPFNGQQAS